MTHIEPLGSTSLARGSTRETSLGVGGNFGKGTIGRYVALGSWTSRILVLGKDPWRSIGQRDGREIEVKMRLVGIKKNIVVGKALDTQSIVRTRIMHLWRQLRERRVGERRVLEDVGRIGLEEERNKVGIGIALQDDGGK